MSRDNAESHVNFGAWPVPAARLTDIIIHESEVAGEILIYDRERDHMHHLNSVAAAIWRMCDGRRSLDALALDTSLALGTAISEETARMALMKLEDANLLDAPLPVHLRVTGTSRRRFMKRMAAGSLAVPMIVSMSAPQAAAADSGCAARFATCMNHADCCSNSCDQARPGIAGTCW